MRDYDQEIEKAHEERVAALGDRSFKLGGVVWTYDANPPLYVMEILTSDKMLVGDEYIAAVKAACVEMIEDVGDQKKRFRRLIDNEDRTLRVTLIDLQNVFHGLVQEAFKRPTEASSPSGEQDAASGTNSKETTPTELAAASAA